MRPLHFRKIGSILQLSKELEGKIRIMIVRLRGARSKEDCVRRVMLYLLVVVIVFAGYGVRAAVGQEQQPAKPATAAKQVRWHGIIVRISKDQSTMDVRRGTVERKIHFDSSTQWTKGKEVLPDMSQFKEGADVNCMTTPDAKGELHATRCDLVKAE